MLVKEVKKVVDVCMLWGEACKPVKTGDGGFSDGSSFDGHFIGSEPVFEVIILFHTEQGNGGRDSECDGDCS